MLAFVVLSDQTSLKRPSVLYESSGILWIADLFYSVMWSCDLRYWCAVLCGSGILWSFWRYDPCGMWAERCGRVLLCKCCCVYYWDNSETKGVMFHKIWWICQNVLIMISRSTFLHDIVEWLGRWCALLINRIIMRKCWEYIGLSVGKMLALVGFFLAIKEVLLQCITNKSVLYRAKV